jgi:murein DD-endopeptidase MepM/ murein hydrolase activator NlpD
MIYRLAALFLFLFTAKFTYAQLVEVQANYNNIGDVDFIAYNNSKAPLFLNIDFADLENTTFNEPLPYIKLLEPGFNTLFTLERDLDVDVPQFHYQIKYYRSNPMAQINLDFPYLIPLAPGMDAQPLDVKNVQGFWGVTEPKGWLATGFVVKPGQTVYAARNGIVVEAIGNERKTDSQTWYNAWTNVITLLQSDGTLMCYRNVVDPKKKLKIGDKIFAGQQLGVIAKNASELVLLIYQDSLNSDNLLFIIPKFVTAKDKVEMIVSSKKYKVVHPDDIRALEMSKKEIRKILN